MRIRRLTAENIKRIRVVDITPDGSVVQITGANGSGKSSVLDAIYWALAGKGPIEPQPIRQGETSARIQLDLGEITVTRVFSEAGTSLIVEAESGARFPSPQRMLDELLGSLTFDPLAFARMDSKDQLNQLRKLVKLDVDVDTLRAESAAMFANRTQINRDVKALRARLAGMPDAPPDTPAEPISVSLLTKRLMEAAETNTAIQREKDRRAKLPEEEAGIAGLIEERRQKIAALELQIEALATTLEKLRANTASLPPLAEPEDTGALARDLDHAQQVNQAIRVREERNRVAEEAAAAEMEADELTERMEGINAAISRAIADARMPIEGLSFAEEGVTYNGLPFEQASSAEQLRVSVALAMAAHPKLRVLRIKDGSLLDDHSLAIIAAMADDQDYQVWIERVDTSGKVGVVMEDGMRKGVSDVG